MHATYLWFAETSNGAAMQHFYGGWVATLHCYYCHLLTHLDHIYHKYHDHHLSFPYLFLHLLLLNTVSIFNLPLNIIIITAITLLLISIMLPSLSQYHT